MTFCLGNLLSMLLKSVIETWYRVIYTLDKPIVGPHWVRTLRLLKK